MHQGTKNYSVNNSGADDIKKGLQRIKQAQIEVLRELRKQDPQLSRNYSLTYSKETTLDSKPNLKFDGESTLLKQKIQKLQFELGEAHARQNKVRKEYLSVVEEGRKIRENWGKMESKLKEYEKGEQRALAKAQQGLSNAINSQKKYITLKGEYDKLIKQRQRWSSQVRRLQKKQLQQLLRQPLQNSQLPQKLLTQLQKINTIISDILKQFSTHKCTSTSNNKQHQQTSSQNSTSNQQQPFSFSILETQHTLTKSMTNVILFVHSIVPMLSQNNYMENTYVLSQSFREDIRKIQEEERKNNGKGRSKDKEIGNSSNNDGNLTKKMKNMEQQIKEYKQQITSLRQRVKNLVKQVEELGISKTILDEQYQKYKLRVKQKQRLKQEEIDELKKKMKNVDRESAQQNRKKKNRIMTQPSESVLAQKLTKLQQENKHLQKTISSLTQHQSSLTNLLQSQKSQLESLSHTNTTTQQSHSLQLQKLTHQLQTQTSANKKNQQEWDQLIRVISKLQQQNITYVEKQKIYQNKIQMEKNRCQRIIKDMETELKDVKDRLEEERRFSVGVGFQRGELVRLRGLEDGARQGNMFGKAVQDLWKIKQGEYNNLANLIEQVKPKASNQQQKVAIQQQQVPVQQIQQVPIQQVQQYQISMQQAQTRQIAQQLGEQLQQSSQSSSQRYETPHLYPQFHPLPFPQQLPQQVYMHSPPYHQQPPQHYLNYHHQPQYIHNGQSTTHYIR